MAYRRKNGALDENGAPVQTDTYHQSDADRLLRFNITGQRIANLCNEERQFFPWDNEVHRSTWHRALKGDPVWDEIVDELRSLYEAQVRDPRAYLPDKPDDNLFDWMKQIAGAKWWIDVLQLDMKQNTLNAWMSRGTSQKNVDAIRARVDEWWQRVDAACAQADMIRAYHAIQRHSDPRWTTEGPAPDSFASYFFTYVQEDGHTVDEARAHYVEMADLARNHVLSLLDLADPKPVASRGEFQRASLEYFAKQFDEFWAHGFDDAMPRDMPENTDLSDTVSEGQWKDRRYEEGPWDENVGLYKLHYRQRISWRWCSKRRRKQVANVHILAVSVDGQNWQTPTERQALGWYNAGVEIARWRAEHGESPDNQYLQAVNEAELALSKARIALRDCLPHEREQCEAAVLHADEEHARALKDY